MSWLEDPEGELYGVGERALGRLEKLPLDDCWTVRPHAALVGHVRSSLYVEDELHLIDADGEVRPSGLPGGAIGARAGHRVTIVHLTARNSGRERPVLLFDHDTNKAAILDGNFAPLLRSRFELAALLAGLGAALGLAAAGVFLSALIQIDEGRIAITMLFIGGCMVPIGIVFTGNRRTRLRRHLVTLCQKMIADLRDNGGVFAGPVSVSAPAADAPPPAA